MFDMNCEEFQFRLDGTVIDSESIAHLEGCAACRRFAYAREELNLCLTALREAAPRDLRRLDESVIQAFRREEFPNKALPRAGRFPAVVWGAMAAMLIVGLALALERRHSQSPTEAQVARVEQKTAVANQSVHLAETVQARTFVATGKPAHRRPVRPVRKDEAFLQEAAPAVAGREEPDNDFQNLMYCDALSCAGEMQMIRIELPAAAINRVPALRPASGLVQADVVVGSDGIARAIRIVK
jgi:hypothetical protein